MRNKGVSDERMNGGALGSVICCLHPLPHACCSSEKVLSVPYWQDDCYNLFDATKAGLAGESWLAPFLPAQETNFRRPLEIETY